MLSIEDKQFLLSQFPKIELFYEKVNHNKASTDYCMAIPEGRKNFAWFTCFKNKFVCVLLEQGFQKKCTDIRIYNCCFKNELAYDTIFYGTFTQKRFFYVEDIYRYKNTSTDMMTNHNKLLLMEKIFTNELKQVSYTKGDVIFGLPVMKTTYDDLYNAILTLPYKTYSVQFRNMNNNFRSVYLMSNENLSKAVFMVKASIQNDIYELYCNFDARGIMKHGTARIPNYSTSILMNNLFRTIKENDNLDRLEESDDEDEFENTNLDKFVDLKKRVMMECVYNQKFRKWVPFKVANVNKVIDIKEVRRMEK